MRRMGAVEILTFSRCALRIKESPLSRALHGYFMNFLTEIQHWARKFGFVSSDELTIELVESGDKSTRQPAKTEAFSEGKTFKTRSIHSYKSRAC